MAKLAEIKPHLGPGEKRRKRVIYWLLHYTYRNTISFSFVAVFSFDFFHSLCLFPKKRGRRKKGKELFIGYCTAHSEIEYFEN